MTRSAVHDQRVVLLALAEVTDCVGFERYKGRGHGVPPRKIAAATPRFLTRTASGQPGRPLGERRVRTTLRELIADGRVESWRSWAWPEHYYLTLDGAESARPSFDRYREREA